MYMIDFPLNRVRPHSLKNGVSKIFYVILNGLSRIMQHQIKKTMTEDYIKEPHTAIFTGQTGCGKTHLVLDLIENYYNKHFDYIFIICPTLRINKTYQVRDWIKNVDKVWLIEPKDNLSQ